MGSRAPGGVVLVTFAETKVTRGAGRSNPQLAFKVKSRQRRLLIIQCLDLRFRGDDSCLFGGLRQKPPNFQPRVQQNPLHPFGGVNVHWTFTTTPPHPT